MRGYCPKCREYRSDDGSDAWGFYWKDGLPVCRRCGHLVDLFNHGDKQLTLKECPKDRKFLRIVRRLAEKMKRRKRVNDCSRNSAHSLET